MTPPRPATITYCACVLESTRTSPGPYTFVPPCAGSWRSASWFGSMTIGKPPTSTSEVGCIGWSVGIGAGAGTSLPPGPYQCPGSMAGALGAAGVVDELDDVDELLPGNVGCFRKPRAWSIIWRAHESAGCALAQDQPA